MTMSFGFAFASATPTGDTVRIFTLVFPREHNLIFDISAFWIYVEIHYLCNLHGSYNYTTSITAHQYNNRSSSRNNN